MGKIDGKRTRGQQRMRWLDSTTNSVDMNLSKLQEMVKDREAWHAAVHGVTKGQIWLSTWTITNVAPGHSFLLTTVFPVLIIRPDSCIRLYPTLPSLIDSLIFDFLPQALTVVFDCVLIPWCGLMRPFSLYSPPAIDKSYGVFIQNKLFCLL